MAREEIPDGDQRILIVSLTEAKLVGVMSSASPAKVCGKDPGDIVTSSNTLNSSSLISQSWMNDSLARIVVAFALASAALATSACGQAPTASSTTSLGGFETGIIGGTEITGTEPYAPHVVGIYDASMGAICTGSILSPSIIVTAAHCVESGASSLRIVFGNDFNSRSIVVRAVDAYQVSPLWPFRQNTALNTGDIALIKFSGGLPAGYKAIKFLTDSSKLSDGMTVTLAGFGASEVVRVRDPRSGALASDHQGSGKLRYVDTTISSASFTKSEFITDSKKGRGACHGDSGGPAFVTVDGEMVVTGVTSRSVDDPEDTCAVGAAYTSIPFYAKWIVQTANQLNSMTLADRSARSTTVAHR